MSPDRPTREAAAHYEQSLPLEERRRTGTVYTPPHLVDLILDLADYTPDHPIENRTFLDPSCGCGVFLEHAVERLARRLERLPRRSSRQAHAELFLTTIEQNLFGLDKDENAAALALRAVQEAVASRVGREAVPTSFFAGNIDRGDFLHPQSQLDLFDPAPKSRTFDFIVGNPPYVTTTRLTPQEKDDLRARFQSAHGRIDLYSLFFERGLELLNDGGILAFITPDKYLTSESATPLRKLMMARGALRSVARFRSHRIFNGAATVPCVTVLEKTTRHEPVVYLELRDTTDRQKNRRIETAACAALDPPPPQGEAWYFHDPALERIANKLQDQRRTLSHVSRRISAGIATGRDQIYVLPPGMEADMEPELLHPVVRGQDLRAFVIEPWGAHVIIPYSEGRDKRPELVDLSSFPKTLAYLNAHRETLETRHCVRRWSKAWYDIHDPWTLSITGMPKILFPDVANSNRFALDEGRYCPLHSAYYILPTDISTEYLVALLNSSAIEFLIRLHAPLVKDGFSRYRKQFVAKLPIPEMSQRAEREVVRHSGKGDLDAIDTLVSKAFGLTAGDTRLISHHVTEARSRSLPERWESDDSTVRAA